TKLALRCLARRGGPRGRDRPARRRAGPPTERAAPRLRALQGVGPDVAGQLLVTAGDNPERLVSEGSFARLCGVAPLEASTGQTLRHRLNPGGDRQANSALYIVVMTRLRHDPRTQAYAKRRTAEGKIGRASCRERVVRGGAE